MNPALEELFRQQLIRELPSPQQEIYHYVAEREEALAEQTEDADTFLSLLVEHDVYKEAGDHFGMPARRIVRLLTQVEYWLEDQIENRTKNVQWVDCSQMFENPSSQKTFYLSI